MLSAPLPRHMCVMAQTINDGFSKGDANDCIAAAAISHVVECPRQTPGLEDDAGLFVVLAQFSVT
jgi:hypothetical protein